MMPRPRYVAGGKYRLKGVRVIAVAGSNCCSEEDSIMCEFHAEEKCDGMKCASAENDGQPMFFLTPNNFVKARLLGHLDDL